VVDIFGKIRDRISGPKRCFVVENIKREAVSTGKVYGSISDGLVSVVYSREIPATLVAVELCVDGTKYQLDTLEAIGEVFLGESFDGVFPEQFEILKQMKGQPVSIRSNPPYNSNVLKKLARINKLKEKYK
jgi:hypothetical protein